MIIKSIIKKKFLVSQLKLELRMREKKKILYSFLELDLIITGYKGLKFSKNYILKKNFSQI